MFEYVCKEEFDIGSGYGLFEYDFFDVKSEDDFTALAEHYKAIHKRFGYRLDGYSVTENNAGLSPAVQAKMKGHKANVSVTFLTEAYWNDNVSVRNMTANRQTADTRFDTYHFYFYLHKEEGARDYLEKGIAHAGARLDTAAVAYFTKGIELDPNISHLYAYRAISYHARRNYDEAVSDFAKAIELDGANSYLYSLRALVYKDSGEIGKAVADFRKALELNPKDKVATENLMAIKKAFEQANDIHGAN